MLKRELSEIRAALKRKAGERIRESAVKFVPTAEKVHGVSVLELNKMVSKYKSGGFELVEALLNSEYLEEKILGAKILGKICKTDPDKTLNIVRRYVKKLNDWATCDTLATQGIRNISKIKEKEFIKMAKDFAKSANPWIVRFGLVILINFRKDEGFVKIAEDVLSKVNSNVRNDKYVKKAMEWVRRVFDIKKE